MPLYKLMRFPCLILLHLSSLVEQNYNKVTSVGKLGGSPGLVVLRGDSCIQRSWVQIPALYTGWIFFHIPICCKICNVFEITKINEKEAGVGPILKSFSRENANGGNDVVLKRYRTETSSCAYVTFVAPSVFFFFFNLLPRLFALSIHCNILHKFLSSGLVVMRGDLCLKVVCSNPGAVYWMVITFFTNICCKNCIVCLKRQK